MEKKISIIVAVANNNAIGKDNKLLWHISEDMKRFKRLTSGHTVVMGMKTFESLPVKPLPERTNIIITAVPGKKIEGCMMAYSIEEAISKCDESKENFIIGGASIYKQFLPLADILYLTKVNKDYNADCFFPEIDLNNWEITSKEDGRKDEKNDFTYSYLVYERKKTAE